MSARDTIADAIRFTGELLDDHFDRVAGDPNALADAVIAAVRAMPVEDIAELIGGAVSRDRDLSTNRPIARVVGIWKDDR